MPAASPRRGVATQRRTLARRGAERIEWWPISRLTPYDKNPRTHPESQITALMALITEVGFNVPLLVDGDAGIIAGHGRLEAAKRLRMREVPVIELTHMTPAQKRAQIIADARITSMGGWDVNALAAELHALEADRFDISLTGFSDEDLQRLNDDLDAQRLRDLTAAGGAHEVTTPAASPGGGGTQAALAAGDETPPPATSGAGEPRNELLPFSVQMVAENRARLFEALNVAKRKWSLDTSADALLAMANDFLGRETT